MGESGGLGVKMQREPGNKLGNTQVMDEEAPLIIDKKMEKLFALHKKSTRLAASILRSKGFSDYAEDVVSESYVSAQKSLISEKFCHDATLKNWFFGIVTNKAIDFLRRSENSKVEPISIVDNSEEEWEKPISDHYANNPEQWVANRQEWAILQSALDDLPKEYSEAIKATIIDGMSNEEAAEKAGIPLNTQKTHKKRGIEMLREKILGIIGER